MQWAALYSTPPAPSPSPPLGLYVGAHSTRADLMLLLMTGQYCAPPPPPGFQQNGYLDQLNETLQHGVDSGSAGGDIATGVGPQLSALACATKCGEIKECLAWVWNSHTRVCYPKSKLVAPLPILDPPSTADIYGCSPSYPAMYCTSGGASLLPNPNDCGSSAAMRWLHFPENEALNATGLSNSSL